MKTPAKEGRVSQDVRKLDSEDMVERMDKMANAIENLTKIVMGLAQGSTTVSTPLEERKLSKGEQYIQTPLVQFSNESEEDEYSEELEDDNEKITSFRQDENEYSLEDDEVEKKQFFSNERNKGKNLRSDSGKTDVTKGTQKADPAWAKRASLLPGTKRILEMQLQQPGERCGDSSDDETDKRSLSVKTTNYTLADFEKYVASSKVRQLNAFSIYHFLRACNAFCALGKQAQKLVEKNWHVGISSSLRLDLFRLNYEEGPGFNTSADEEGWHNHKPSNVKTGIVFTMMTRAPREGLIGPKRGWIWNPLTEFQELNWYGMQRLLQLVVTPKNLQEFYIALVNMIRLRFAKGTGLKDLPPTNITNMREHYHLYHEFVHELEEYYTQLFLWCVEANRNWGRPEVEVRFIEANRGAHEIITEILKELGNDYLCKIARRTSIDSVVQTQHDNSRRKSATRRSGATPFDYVEKKKKDRVAECASEWFTLINFALEKEYAESKRHLEKQERDDFLVNKEMVFARKTKDKDSRKLCSISLSYLTNVDGEFVDGRQHADDINRRGHDSDADDNDVAELCELALPVCCCEDITCAAINNDRAANFKSHRGVGASRGPDPALGQQWKNPVCYHEPQGFACNETCQGRHNKDPLDNWLCARWLKTQVTEQMESGRKRLQHLEEYMLKLDKVLESKGIKPPPPIARTPRPAAGVGASRENNFRQGGRGDPSMRKPRFDRGVPSASTGKPKDGLLKRHQFSSHLTELIPDYTSDTEEDKQVYDRV